MGIGQNFGGAAIAGVPAMRQCPFCGVTIVRTLTQCPACRESLLEIRQPTQRVRERDPRIRRGLLCMLMAAVIHYFAGGYSAMYLPAQINSVVTNYLTPLLFLSGLGLLVFGLISSRRTA